MTLDVQHGGLGLIRVQLHTTHSQLRACLSCPLTPTTSQQFCSLLSLTLFWYVGLNLYRDTSSLLFLNTLISRRSVSILCDFDFTPSRLWRFSTRRCWYLLYSYDSRSLELPYWPFMSKALSEEDEGSMCLGNWVIANPAQTLFIANLSLLYCLGQGLCSVISEPQQIGSIRVTWPRVMGSQSTNQRLHQSCSGSMKRWDPPMIRFFL